MRKYKQYKFSIIIPSFNQGKFIKQTIESIISQRYPNLEIFVVDGGSSDDTVKILKSFGRKIKWISEKDKGQTHAINKGLKEVSGDIIAYLNSDDYYLPDTLKIVSEYFTNNPQCYWLSGDYIIVNEKGKKIQKYIKIYKKILRLKPTFYLLLVTNFINQPSTFFRKELINNIGLFNQSLNYCMDYDYCIRAYKKYKLHVLNNNLSCFRIHGASKGGSEYQNQFKEEYFIAKQYTKNYLILLAHKLHNYAILLIYNIIK